MSNIYSQLLAATTPVRKEFQSSHPRSLCGKIGAFSALIIAMFYYGTPMVSPPIFDFILGILSIGTLGAIGWFASDHFAFHHSYPGLQKIDHPKLMRTFVLAFDLLSKSPEANLMTSLEKQCNAVIFQFPHRSKVIGMVGLTLTAMALQINPNYADFLRKLYEMQEHLPLTIQISVQKHPQGETRAMAYDLLVTRTMNGFLTEKALMSFINLLRQAFLDLETAVETNFPHSRFEPLQGDRLITALRQPYSVADAKFHFLPAPVEWERLVIQGCLFLLNLITIMILMPALPEILNTTLYISPFIIIGFMLRDWYGEEALGSLDPARCREVDLWPNLQWVYQRQMNAMGLYNPRTHDLQAGYSFTFEAVNRHFHFNPTKFYRIMLERVLQRDFACTMDMMLTRVLPAIMIPYMSAFTPRGWDIWAHTTEATSRYVLGFWTYQPLITILQRLKITGDPSVTDFIQMDGVLSDTFNPIFQSYFSYSPLFRCPATPQVWMELFTKSRNVYRFQSCLPIHFDTGLQLLPYLEIPEEIHKAIPSFYPGEFSTPLLEDELIFGDTLNPEHGQKEHPAGITIGELPSNILVGGQNLDQIVKNQCRIAIACQQHNLPMIIFDWSGNWMPYIQAFRHTTHYEQIKYVKVGTNFGLSLFDLPHSPQGPIKNDYIEKMLQVCELAYHFNEGDLALLRQLLLQKGDDTQQIQTITLAQIDAAFGPAFNPRSDTTEAKPDRSKLHGYLTMWKGQQFQAILDTPMDQWIDLNCLGDNATTLLIDLSDLHDTPLKSFFVHLAMIQCYFIWIIHPDFHRKGIVLPAIDVLFPQKSYIGELADAAPRLQELNQLGCWVLGGSNQISQIVSPILSQFATLLVGRTTDPNQFNILRHLLNLDGVFTNIISQSMRNASYQELFIKTLEPDCVVVMRPHLKLPYICAMEYGPLVTTEPSKQYSDYPEIQSSLQVSHEAQILTAIESKSLIEHDFPAENAAVHAKIIFFLRQLAKEKDTFPTHLYPGLKADLQAILDGILRTAGKTTSEVNTITEIILQKLITAGYLVKGTTTFKESNVDTEHFACTDKVEKVLQDWDNRSKLNTNAMELEEKKEEETEKTAIASFPPESPIAEQSGAEMDEPTALELMKRTIADLYVNSRVAFKDADFAYGCDILKDGINGLLATIKTPPRYSHMDRLQGILDQVSNLFATLNDDPAAIAGVLQQLENYVVSLP